MGGQFGVVESVKVAQTAASLLNAVVKIVKGGGLFAIFELVGPFNILSTVKFDQFKSEVLELDAGEREQVEQAFALKLDLSDKVLQQKLIESADAINEAVDLVFKGVAVGNDILALVARFRQILGV